MFWQILVVIYVCVLTCTNTEEFSLKQIIRPEPVDGNLFYWCCFNFINNYMTLNFRLGYFSSLIDVWCYIICFLFAEYILCRGCGSEIVDSYDLFYKLSPESKSAFNETLFSKERVLIQILSNRVTFDFAVLTSEKASCHGIGEVMYLINVFEYQNV